MIVLRYLLNGQYRRNDNVIYQRIQDISHIENHLTRLLSETIEEESELDRVCSKVENYMIH